MIMKSHSLTLLCALALAFTLRPLPAQETVILKESFDSRSRPGWFNSNASSGLIVSGGQLKAINSNSTFLLHFKPVTLAVGESLTIKFTLTLDAVADLSGGLRIGLFGSDSGAKVSADAFNLSAFTGYQGYRLFANVGNGGSKFDKREPASPSLISGSAWTSLSSSGKGFRLTASTPFPATLSLTRTASGIDASFTINDVTVTASDPAATAFSFDTLAFNHNKGGGNGNLFLDNISITTQKAAQ